MPQQSSEYDYSHASNGTQPTSARNFETGEAAPPEEFDWWWYTTIQKINALVTDISNILDGSETVSNADKVDGQHFTDIQSWVNNNADVPNADLSDETRSVEVRNNDPSSIDGRVWIRSDL